MILSFRGNYFLIFFFLRLQRTRHSYIYRRLILIALQIHRHFCFTPTPVRRSRSPKRRAVDDVRVFRAGLLL